MAKTTAEKKTELMVLDNYRALTMSEESVKEVLATNLKGQKIDEFGLTRIRVPGSGGKFWNVPTLEGDEPKAEITGVIVTFQDHRTYWEKSFAETGGGSPPDCSSKDAVTGVGSPGGNCYECPLSQFGSATTKRKRAERAVLFTCYKRMTSCRL